MSVTGAITASESPIRPVKTRGDRGSQHRRAKLIGNRTAKEMGVKKTTKKVPFYYAYCDHKNPKTGKRQCSEGRNKKPFTGYTPQIVMGNKAAHEEWHESQDRKIAEAL